MGYNFDGKIITSSTCQYDSNIGFEADFSKNGEVDGWTYYNGIHTYGCWNNFLFGTLYGDSAVIGKMEVFRPVAAEDFYKVRIVMKLNIKERFGVQIVPKYGRLMWRTIANPNWTDDKKYDFEIYNDAEWHSYVINMANAQWWQGDVNDLRVYPILSDGRDGDEFYIRAIEILSIDKYRCLNVSCNYYTQYEHNCRGIGERGYCKSKALSGYVFAGTTFEFADDKFYNIEKDINDIIIVNINDYGYENVRMEPFNNYRGADVANALAKELAKLDIGGYSEVSVVYTEKGEFIIYSGTYADDSTVIISYSKLAEDLNFFSTDEEDISIKNDTSIKYVGKYPSSGFLPYSSYRIKTNQVYALLDSSTKTEFYFNPFLYNVEGGRRDWLETGLGDPSKDIREGEGDTNGQVTRYYDQISNANKTLIDFTHPINTSGRITKVYAGITLDQGSSGSYQNVGGNQKFRLEKQLKEAKIMFFRPLKGGNIKVLPIELSINNRVIEEGKLYSCIQEYVELDCDIFLNEGDLIGVYNANMYRSKGITGDEVDALYYQVPGKASGIIEVREPSGNGASGLLLYARSNQMQSRLSLNIDLGNRLNITDIDIVGRAEENKLVYNIAKCLDVRWEVDMFGEDHTTGYIISYRPLKKEYQNHPNLYYGKDCLNDGIKTVPDGIAADSFSVETISHGYRSWEAAVGKKNGGRGTIVNGAKYFQTNGDEEWLGVYVHVDQTGPFAYEDFEEDPIAFTLLFPYNKDKQLSGITIYFKERYNFRNFALSVYRGPEYLQGNADDKRFDLIPNRTDGTNTPWNTVTLDGLDYVPEDKLRWSTIDLYLAKNPCIGKPIKKITGPIEVSFDGPLGGGGLASYFDSMGGLVYYTTGVITNNTQFLQATNIDWSTISYDWPLISAKGFRLYCNDHSSTKICEFEVYCAVENIKSAMGGSIETIYSAYTDYWYESQNKETEYGINAFIGDSPQYINITVKPITEISLSDIIINVSYEDVFMGNKGCQYLLLPEETKIGTENSSQMIEFKNVYKHPYDLLVDISKGSIVEEGVIFYSLMNNKESLDNPLVGSDAFYKKTIDYLLLNYQKNVAINCPVYALKNLIDGAHAWYSHDKEYSWRYWGKITNCKNINFSNLPNSAITTINLPVLKRSQWWKIGFYDPRVVTSIQEIHIYYNNEEINGIQFYHQKNSNAISTGNINTAPHLSNDIIDGSYYILKGDNNIGFRLPNVQEIDKIVMYHDYFLEYENSHDKAGIDSSTAFCLHGDGDTYQTDSLVDVSYYEHNVTVVGSGIYCDEGYETTYYDFVQDFSDCEKLIETFSDTMIDTEIWTDLVGVTISGSKLCITNSGIVGSIKTTTYFYNNFDARIDLDVENGYSGMGWGCYLEAVADDNTIVRVGRSYITVSSYPNTFVANGFGSNGWSGATYKSTSNYIGLKLKLIRLGDITTCYGWDSNNIWYTIGSYNTIGASPVQFRFVSDLTPLAFGKVTVGKFDNFSIDKVDLGWGVNEDNLSTFTCTSGVGPNGWVYRYDTSIANNCDASGYKIPKIYDFQNYPLDESFAFTFDFTFQTETFFSYTGLTTNDYGVSVGLLGRHINTVYYQSWQNYFTGAQIVLRRNNIGIGIRNDWAEGSENYVTLDTAASIYYCRFTSDGHGNYHCYVWTDGFDGILKLVDFGLQSSITWQAYKIGVGSSYNGSGYSGANGRGTGWVSDFDFKCDKVSHNHVIHGSSIKFSGFPKEKILVDYKNSSKCNIVKEGFHIDTKNFTFDFFIKFNSLPVNDGDKIYLFKCWDDNTPLLNNTYVTMPCSWAFIIERVSDGYRWRFYISNNSICKLLMDWNFYPDMQRWYHFYLSKIPYSNSHVIVFLRNGHQVWSYFYNNINLVIDYSGLDVHIGENLNGWMEEIRVSSDYTLGGTRDQLYNQYYNLLSKAVPTKQYERYYTMVVYDSSDNINYGIQMYVDVLFDNSYSYHEPFSIWSVQYYTFFAIDLGQRHDLEIIRSFPVDTSYTFSLTSNIVYSNKDVSDPKIAFSLNTAEIELNTNFDGQNYDYPHNWTKLDTTKATSYIIDGTFYQSCLPGMGQEHARAKTNFYFDGDFDFYIDYNLGDNYPMINTWEISVQIDDIDNINNKVKFERCFKDNGNQYILWVQDNSSSFVSITTYWTNAKNDSIRIERVGSIFKVYIKSIKGNFEDFVLVSRYQMKNTFSSMSQLNLYTLSDSPAYPHIKVWWDNFIVVKSKPIYSTFQDARWMKVKMLNGDGITKTIIGTGIYSDISTQRNEVGQYNNYWTPLGSACTSYANAENIALGATISGSSYVGLMSFDNIVNGILSNDINQCWGSGEEAHPYFTIHFNNIESIFRFKVFHGLSTSDTDNIITDYKIQVSTDGEIFSTVFTIINNNKFERIHDLAAPVYAKVVRFYVDKYKSIDRFVWVSKEVNYNYWSGAVLREFEVYKYYGFTIINSEDNPIIAIDLQHQFFVDGHSLVGIDTEASLTPENTDWDNSDSNFAWSNSNLSNPHKVEFGEWGATPGLSKWVVLKRNTATHYPIVPVQAHPLTDTPDFLKHVIISASPDEIGSKPNPIEYPWMWRSNISELSYDYDKITYGVSVARSLKINYPASTNTEHVRFIEGDHFGWDKVASWRDGMGTYLYIDDIDNLDLGYGYFYLGGKDYTSQHNSVIHKWNMTTFSGILKSGWNNINLTFLYADDTMYTEMVNMSGRDPRRLYSINWGTMGFVFRGKGRPLQLNFEGIYIERNHFEHSCYKQHGLYLHGNDIMKAPIGGLNLHSGAIEFWIRPDWTWDGTDRYNDFKYRTLFHLGNVANDIFGAAVSSGGLEVYYGNVLKDFNIFTTGGFSFPTIDKVFHIAFVFSNNGRGMSDDGSTIRIYINNELASKSTRTWVISDDKHFNFIIGGQGLLVQKSNGFDFTSSAVDAVICRLKIHNYCKIDYSDCVLEDFNKLVLTSSNFVEISKDNVTFNKVGSKELPFLFKEVAPGEIIPIWAKVLLPKELTGYEKRTAQLISSWDIGV
jgi:F5/8 type C domain